MNEFLSGVIATSFGACGLFFFFFWRQTRDRLFLCFAVATWLLAFERLPLMLVEAQNEFRPMIYLIRLSASCVILFAVIQKNFVRARA